MSVSGMLTVEDKLSIARICHEAYVSFMAGAGHKVETSFDDVKGSLLDGIEYMSSEYDYLYEKHAGDDDKMLIDLSSDELLAKSHDNWVNYKVTEGWRYGSELSYSKKTNPNLCNWHELNDFEKAKGMVFVMAFYHARRIMETRYSILKVAYQMGDDFVIKLELDKREEKKIKKANRGS